MPSSFLEFLQSMEIAMEADDITSTVSNEVRSAIGGTPSTEPEEATREDEEDLGKVDDIFGTEAPSNDDPSGNPEQDVEDGAEDIGNPDDLGTEDPENGEGEEGGDSDSLGDDTQTTDDQNGQSSSDDLIFTKKNRIRDNLVQLYTVISGDIEIIVNSLTNINDSKTIQVMNAVINHLRNCKSYIYKTLTQNIKDLEYDELLQRYITLKRVYDICIEMMQKHFDIQNKDTKKK